MRYSPLRSRRAPSSPNTRPRKRARNTRNPSSLEESCPETEAVTPANALPPCEASAISFPGVVPPMTGENTVPTTASSLPQMHEVDRELLPMSSTGDHREPVSATAQYPTESRAHDSEASRRVVSEPVSLPQSALGHTLAAMVANASQPAADVHPTSTATTNPELLPSEFAIAMPMIACPNTVLSPVIAGPTTPHDNNFPLAASYNTASDSPVAQASSLLQRSGPARGNAVEVRYAASVCTTIDVIFLFNRRCVGHLWSSRLVPGKHKPGGSISPFSFVS